MVLIPVRPGTLSDVRMAEELSATEPDFGITAAYQVPMNAASTFIASQADIDIPLYTGDRTMDAHTWGEILAAGGLPIDFDFLFFGRLFNWFMGRGNYTQPSGSSKPHHRWTNSAGSSAAPAYVQIENHFGPSTDDFVRHVHVRVDTLPFKQNLKGAVVVTPTFMGVGNVRTTSLMPSPVASLTNDGPFFVPNYYSGMCILNSIPCNPTLFDFTPSNGCARTEAAYLNGEAAGVMYDKMSGKGNLELLFATPGALAESSLYFYNLAAAKIPVPFEWWIFDAATMTNGVVTGGWTKYWRLRAWINLMKKTPVAAGKDDRKTNQSFVVASSPSCVWPGELIAPLPGPYTLPASAALGFKPDAGGTITTALGITGVQQTSAIVTALNADVGAGHFAEKLIADNIAGALRVSTKASGGAHSVQVDGTIPNTAHTAIGFNTVAQVGYDATPFMGDLLNGLGSSY